MIEGYWYTEGQSDRVAAYLQLDSERYYVHIDTSDVVSGSVDQVSISDRVGSIPRKITISGQGVFETRDNDAVDHWLKTYASDKGSSSLVHSLESSVRFALISIVFVVACAIGFYQYGLPWMSHKLAFALPITALEAVGEKGMSFMDEHLFEQSGLPEDRREKIRSHFLTKIVPLAVGYEGHEYRLHFRQFQDKDVPNAFALPSGDIVVTDAFIALADNQQQIDSVLLHEIGHVVHRHSMQQMIRASSLTIIVMLFVGGDLSFIEELAVGLPTFLVQQGYSRTMETEADQFALELIARHNLGHQHFADILRKFSEYQEKQMQWLDAETEKTLEILSTHPATQDRIDAAEAGWNAH